ncbi:BTB-POZ domain-containing protein [Pyrenophora tritici-repentis]|nr:BTB-POZ domain-containing protein [Pyrenophora tritici-repentis]
MGSSQVPAESSSLFNKKVFSDVTIRQTNNAVTKKYYAHKVILCSGSQWFTRALTGNFKVWPETEIS